MYYKLDGVTQRLTGTRAGAYTPQRSDGIPVHLKRGLMDKLMYRTTMGLTVGGTLYCLVALYFATQSSNK